jgi:hypothetical protein
VDKMVLNNFSKKKNNSTTKILKKSQSDKYLVKPPTGKGKKNEQSSNVTLKK